MKFLKVFIPCLFLVYLIKTLGFTSCTIPFSGMENSLYEGERVIVNKWSYGLRLPFMCLLSYHRLAGKKVGKNDIIVFNNPASGKECISSKEVFISRCVGQPGDTLMLDQHLNPTKSTIKNPNHKTLYAYPKEKEDLLLQQLKELNIRNNELISYRGEEFIRSFSHYELYLLKQKTGDTIPFTSLHTAHKEDIYPYIIPGKGITISIYPWNKELMAKTIAAYEEAQVELKGDSIYINGEITTSYTFTKDYYWVLSDNIINRHDSRLFGFVPMEYIIGKASLIWFSKEKSTSLFNGYRWNRFLKQ